MRRFDNVVVSEQNSLSFGVICVAYWLLLVALPMVLSLNAVEVGLAIEGFLQLWR